MEELRLILQTLTALGESGKEAFMWWLIADKVIPAILGMTAIIVAGALIHRYVIQAEDVKRLVELYRNAIGDTAYYLSDNEYRDLHNWVIKHSNRHND